MADAAWASSATPSDMWPALAGRASPRKLRLFVVACCRRVSSHMPAAMRALVDVGERYADGEAGGDEVRAAAGPAFPDLDSLFADVDRVREELAARHPRTLVERVVELALGGGEYPSPGHRFDWVTDLAAARAAACPDEPLDRAISLAEHAAQALSDTADRVVEASGEGDPWEAAAGVSTEAAAAAALLGPYDEYHLREAAEWAAHAGLLRDIFGDPFSPVALLPAWRTEAVVGLAAGIYADRAFDRLPVLADALEDAGCADPDILAHCRRPGQHALGCWVVDLVLVKG